MNGLEARLEQDRALRDAALRLFKTDLAVIRGEVEARGIGARLTDRLTEGAMDLLDDAIDYADDNRGKVALGVAAAALVAAHGPILRALGLADEEDDDEEYDENDEEPDRAADGSDG